MAEHIGLSVALTFGLTIVSILLLIRSAPRLGLVDHPDERKRHTAPTPMVGGIAMFIGICAPLALIGPWPPEIQALLAGSALLVAVGAADDAWSLSWSARFIAQGLAAAILVAWGGMRIDSLGNLFGLGPIDLGVMAVPFTIFAVVGLVNAINMLDGLDGLAGGVTLAILAPMLIYAYAIGLELVLVPGLLVAAGIIAFLLFNYRFPWRHKAHTFMGDAGSNLLGFVLAWMAIALFQSEASSLSPIAILWIVGLPVADTVLTMWRRRRGGRSPFEADHDHVHYVLQQAGFGVNATVHIVSGVALLYASIGIVASLDQVREPLLTLGLVVLLVVHNLTLTNARRVTRTFRHRLTAAESTEE